MVHSSAACIETQHRKVLDMLGQQEWPAFEHENALAAIRAAEPKMFGEGRPKRTAANDDEVEWAQIASRWETAGVARVGVDGNEHIVESVTDVAPKRISREIGIRCRQSNLHDATSCTN